MTEKKILVFQTKLGAPSGTPSWWVNRWKTLTTPGGDSLTGHRRQRGSLPGADGFFLSFFFEKPAHRRRLELQFFGLICSDACVIKTAFNGSLIGERSVKRITSSSWRIEHGLPAKKLNFRIFFKKMVQDVDVEMKLFRFLLVTRNLISETLDQEKPVVQKITVPNLHRIFVDFWKPIFFY